jgi:hypothetical protein
MKILKAWIYGFYNPSRFISVIRDENKPFLGFQAVLIRSLLNSLLLFLPLHLMGRQPSMPSWLTFIGEADYFLFLTIATPYVFVVMWLFLSGVIYLIVSAIGDFRFNHILNIFGVVSLVVGSALVIWDWIWVAVDFHNYMVLGITHLLFDIWAIWLSVISMKKIMGLGYGLGILLNLLWIILSFPIAMLIMRAPI